MPRVHLTYHLQRFFPGLRTVQFPAATVAEVVAELERRRPGLASYPEDARAAGGQPATLRYLWTLAPGGDDRPGRLYAGTVPGGLFRSEDGGGSFELVRGLWDHPSRAGQWQGGGKDFEHPGLHSVAADPRDADTAWVVPAQGDDRRVAVDRALCVCRTEDGGRTWKALRHGLPQRDCYDVVLRHGLDHSDGRLAFGTTTGHCFVSEDRGGSWTCAGHHLPPIHSVRFA